MVETVIVTGGSGFLGSALIPVLVDAGYSVCNLDLIPSPSDVLRVDERIIDITDRRAMAGVPLAENAHVVHLAGRQYSGPVKRGIRADFFYEGNVQGTRNVLDMADRIDAQSLSFVSTDMVYGKPVRTPVDVGHPRKPFGPYGASKVKAEDMILAVDHSFRSIVYRPRLIVGPGRFGLMSKLFEAIRKNRPVPLIGQGKNIYQMVSVFDCADAILRGIQKPDVSGVFNLGSAGGEASRTLIDSLIGIVGSRSKTVPIPSMIIKPGLRLLDRFNLSPLVPEQFEIADLQYVLDVSRTQDTLGWHASRRDGDMILAAYRRYCELKD